MTEEGGGVKREGCMKKGRRKSGKEEKRSLFPSYVILFKCLKIINYAR